MINFMNDKAPVESGPADLLNEKEFEKVFYQIREYSTIKHILEGNSESVIFNK